MLRYRKASAWADVSHFQWLAAQPVDVHLLPRRGPLVITAHDVLPREPRPGQLRAQRRLYERADAVVVHSEHGRSRLAGLGIRDARVIPHGAFRHLDRLEPRLPSELRDDGSPVVALVGLLRPYKGIDVLYEAWGDGIGGAQLWVCGMPRMPLPPAPPGAQVVPRFLADEELAGVLRRADLVVLPYTEIDQSGVLFCALGLGRPVLLSAVGGFPEIAALGAARAVPPKDSAALRGGIETLLADESERVRLAAGARAAADGALSWDAAAAAHMALYEELA
jgi:glycosyltransferase involved in cell wall biosynthesis